MISTPTPYPYPTTPSGLSFVFINSLQTFINQIIIWLPKLIIALLLWWLGNLLLKIVTKGLKWVDIPGMNWDNKLIGKFNSILTFLGKFLLALIVLDYLGVGQTVIGAIAGGLTLTVGLMLGISFGLSLKPYTDQIVNNFIRKVKK